MLTYTVKTYEKPNTTVQIPAFVQELVDGDKLEYEVAEMPWWVQVKEK